MKQCGKSFYNFCVWGKADSNFSAGRRDIRPFDPAGHGLMVTLCHRSAALLGRFQFFEQLRPLFLDAFQNHGFILHNPVDYCLHLHGQVVDFPRGSLRS